MTTKTCTKCERAKPADAFYPGRGKCKDCYNELKRNRKAEPPPGVTSKCCSRCKLEKPLDAFWRQNDGPYGRRPECKQCR